MKTQVCSSSSSHLKRPPPTDSNQNIRIFVTCGNLWRDKERESRIRGNIRTSMTANSFRLFQGKSLGFFPWIRIFGVDPQSHERVCVCVILLLFLMMIFLSFANKRFLPSMHLVFLIGDRVARTPVRLKRNSSPVRKCKVSSLRRAYLKGPGSPAGGERIRESFSRGAPPWDENFIAAPYLDKQILQTLSLHLKLCDSGKHTPKSCCYLLKGGQELVDH